MIKEYYINDIAIDFVGCKWWESKHLYSFPFPIVNEMVPSLTYFKVRYKKKYLAHVICLKHCSR